MCVLHLHAPISEDFVGIRNNLSPRFTRSTSSYWLDSSELWSGIPDAASNDYVAALFEDIKWGDAEPDAGELTEISYYLFDGESVEYDIEETLFGQQLHEKERAAILSSMEAFASVTGITFVEAFDTEDANISFLMMDNEDSEGYLGWANFPETSPYGYTYSTVNNEMYDLDSDPDAVDPGSYYYLTFTHELGHALGMGHPHDGAVQFPGVGYDEWDEGGDNNLNATPWSVLTYNDVSATNGHSPYYAEYYGFLENLGAFDIATAQYLYGPNLETNAGDTVYALNEFELNGYRSIWDVYGTDD